MVGSSRFDKPTPTKRRGIVPTSVSVSNKRTHCITISGFEVGEDKVFALVLVVKSLLRILMVIVLPHRPSACKRRQTRSVNSAKVTSIGSISVISSANVPGRQFLHVILVRSKLRCRPGPQRQTWAAISAEASQYIPVSAAHSFAMAPQTHVAEEV